MSQISRFFAQSILDYVSDVSSSISFSYQLISHVILTFFDFCNTLLQIKRENRKMGSKSRNKKNKKAVGGHMKKQATGSGHMLGNLYICAPSKHHVTMQIMCKQFIYSM